MLNEANFRDNDAVILDSYMDNLYLGLKLTASFAIVTLFGFIIGKYFLDEAKD